MKRRGRKRNPIVSPEHFNTAKQDCKAIVDMLKENHPRLKYSMRTKNVLLFM